MDKKKLLVIGHHFPEPTTTAAGSRMVQLINYFLNHHYSITFASTAAPSNHSYKIDQAGITYKKILLNDAGFNAFIKELKPDVVLFDRFMTEEQFGWRVSESFPEALRILDTEDLHFLRKAREEAIKKNRPYDQAFLYTDLAKRELAAILRSDLTLVISEVERNLLISKFQIPEDLLLYLPFLIYPNISEKAGSSFSKRTHFMTVGNLKHLPNVDSVLQLKKIWPKIKEALPKAELHVFGAYAPQRIKELHNIKQGFLIKGWADDVAQLMQTYRVQLAPLRFGAGLKGKLIDAMRVGLPSITTPVGAEGIVDDFEEFAGAVHDATGDFVKSAIAYYSDEDLWKSASEKGPKIIADRFNHSYFENQFTKSLEGLLYDLQRHRQKYFVGQILQHHSLQSTKFLSKYIEAKNALS